MALFKNKVQLHNSVEILESILKNGGIREKVGAVVVEKKEGRKVIQSGTIYFRNELIYAASVSGMPIPIAARVSTGGRVAPDELQKIINRVGGDPYSPDITRRLLTQHLIAENYVDIYVKEHFLDNLAEILSWDSCLGKWIENQSTKDFTMPNITFDGIKKIIANREIKKHDFMKELSHFFRPEEFAQITFKRTPVKGANNSLEIEAILNLCDGNNTFEAIANTTGIGRAGVIQTIQNLWKSDYLILKLGAIEVPYKSAVVANTPKENEPVFKAQEATPIELSQEREEKQSKNEIVVSKIPEARVEKLIDESLTFETPVKANVKPEEVFEDEEDDEEDHLIIPVGDESDEVESLVGETINEPQDINGEMIIETPKEVSIIKPENDNIAEESEQDLELMMQDLINKYGVNSINLDEVDAADVIDIDPLQLYLEKAESFDEKEEIRESSKPDIIEPMESLSVEEGISNPEVAELVIVQGHVQDEDYTSKEDVEITFDDTGISEKIVDAPVVIRENTQDSIEEVIDSTPIIEPSVEPSEKIHLEEDENDTIIFDPKTGDSLVEVLSENGLEVKVYQLSEDTEITTYNPTETNVATPIYNTPIEQTDVVDQDEKQKTLEAKDTDSSETLEMEPMTNEARNAKTLPELMAILTELQNAQELVESNIDVATGNIETFTKELEGLTTQDRQVSESSNHAGDELKLIADARLAIQQEYDLKIKELDEREADAFSAIKKAQEAEEAQNGESEILEEMLKEEKLNLVSYEEEKQKIIREVQDITRAFSAR